MRKVWFHREYAQFTGGHLKHSHYVGHVATMRGFTPRITFSRHSAGELLSEERRQLWPLSVVRDVPNWGPRAGDVLFVAGTDWRYLGTFGLDRLPNPIINLIQHVRHAHADTELYEYLAQKAIRICVSQEVADAICATGRVQGPVFVIPNGTDIEPDPLRLKHLRDRKMPVVVVAYKRPDLAQPLCGHLAAANIEHLALTRLQKRGDFLDALAESRVAVCLPHVEEGFYLPALEAMGMGCLLVTLDCVGNRGFCRDEENCLVAAPTTESLVAATERALCLPQPQQKEFLQRSLETVRTYTLAAERQRFQALLSDVDRIWASA